MFKKVATMVLTAGLAGSVLMGCQSKPAEEKNEEAKVEETKAEDTQNEEEKRTINIAMSGAYYPFGFKEGDDVEGLEVDIWKEITDRLGYDLDFKFIEFSGLFGLLDNKEVDSIANAISWTEERAEKYLFADPYIYDTYRFVMRKDDDSLKTLEDLKGKKVGVGAAAIEIDILEAYDTNHEIELVPYSSASGKNNYLDVEMSRIDYCVCNEAEGLIALDEMGLNDKLVVGGPALTVSKNAYPFRKDADGEALCKEVNDTLNEMREDGTLAEISEKWLKRDLTQPIEADIQ